MNIVEKEGDRTYKVEQEGITAAANSILHPTMRNGWCGVWWSEHEVELRFVLPPVVPSGFVCLPLSDPFPLLKSAFLIPTTEETGPYVVATDVLDPQVVDVFEWTRYFHVEVHLGGTWVIPFAGAEERAECFATIRIE